MIAVAEARARVAEVELAMIDEPGMIEALRPARDAALVELRQAESAEDADREREVRQQVREVLHAAEDPHDPRVDWVLRHRRWHKPAIKARLVRAMGRKAYERIFPW